MRDDRDTFDPSDFAPSWPVQRHVPVKTDWRVRLVLALLLTFGAVCLVMPAILSLRGVLR